MNPSKKRILIIDDSEAIHEDFRRILCPEKSVSGGEIDEMADMLFGTAPAQGSVAPEFEVDSALQGQEGLAKVETALASRSPYSLIFLDYRMPPGWSGVETLRHLRRVVPTLPVVLCSAYSDYSWEEILREFEEGTRPRELRKPFNSQELRELAARLTQSAP
ncbi:response regulator [Hyalangium versicolor]|uniref:response regulator n=1 Tax=Hyalangium versicolor TaxID=2861190 RepID=UPI001CCE2781|nr:response regulator [Hyalangium versicolor]